jgi:hypothetical protein
MLEQIGSNLNYRASVDIIKNRVYLNFFGDILNTQGVDGLLPDISKAVARMKPGFTVLADFTEMTMLGLPDVVVSVQTTLAKTAMRKVASVWTEDTFAKMIVDTSAHKVGDGSYENKRRVFKNKAEADAWLDE